MEPPTALEEEDMNNVPEVCDPSSNDEGSVIEEEVVVEVPHPSEHEVVVTAVDAAPVAQEDAPKKSYASIVSYFLFVFCMFEIFMRNFFQTFTQLTRLCSG